MSRVTIDRVFGGDTGWIASSRSIYLSDLRCIYVDDRDGPLARRGSSWWAVVRDRHGVETRTPAVDREDAAHLAAAYVLRAIGVAP